MLRSFWRSFDRFSLHHFQYIIQELHRIKDVDTLNREVVVDLLQSVVEIVTYGDQHDPSIFECFMEHQVLAEFVRMLKISRNAGIEAKVLQYLSIMVQNLHSEHAIYYCFSNGYMNNIITHEYEFHTGDLVLYYVSFLRAVSGKLNRDTICLLLKVQEGIVTSFPLYTVALRFAHHGERMIQTAVRSLTLSIYDVGDDMVYQFLMTPPVSEYFTDLVLKIREEFVHLDTTVCTMGNNYTIDKKKELITGIDKILDDLYYVKDLLCFGKSCLNTLVTQKLLGLLVVPILIPLMQLGKNTCRNGIFSYIFSHDQCLLLASLMLLIILAESNDLDNLVSSAFGFPMSHSETDDAVARELLEESVFIRCMPQILNSLLNILGSTPSSPVTQMHVGWLIRKLISWQRSQLVHEELYLYNLTLQLNASFYQARERLLNELSGCCFEYIPATFEKEWMNCKTGNSIDDWQRMVDAVKIFVLHLQLKAYVVTGCLTDDPIMNLRSTTSPRNNHVSDAISAKFGSQVSLASGIPCKIVFSKVGIRDIYMIPVAKGISGKLLLAEKHPFHPRHGVVLAVTPLAGLSPKIDEKQATWLHLRIRDFTTKLLDDKGNLNSSKYQTDARWTLGFSDAEACEAACLLIAEETCKQRSFVESLLAPLLNDNDLGDEADIKGH